MQLVASVMSTATHPLIRRARQPFVGQTEDLDERLVLAPGDVLRDIEEMFEGSCVDNSSMADGADIVAGAEARAAIERGVSRAVLAFVLANVVEELLPLLPRRADELVATERLLVETREACLGNRTSDHAFCVAETTLDEQLAVFALTVLVDTENRIDSSVANSVRWLVRRIAHAPDGARIARRTVGLLRRELANAEATGLSLPGPAPSRARFEARGADDVIAALEQLGADVHADPELGVPLVIEVTGEVRRLVARYRPQEPIKRFRRYAKPLLELAAAQRTRHAAKSAVSSAARG